MQYLALPAQTTLRRSFSGKKRSLMFRLDNRLSLVAVYYEVIDDNRRAKLAVIVEYMIL